MPGVRSTSPKRRQPSPIESVALKISFRADRATAARVKQAVPWAVVRNGACELKIEGEQPGEVADKAREVLEKLRTALEKPERV